MTDLNTTAITEAMSSSRRKFVKIIGSAAAAGAVLNTLGCGGTNNATSSSSSVSSAASSVRPSSSSVSNSSVASSSVRSSSSAASSSSALAGDVIIKGAIKVTDLAKGGVKSMKVAFPPANPFKNGIATSTPCTTATGTQILGPCHLDLGKLREDISDGELGVPVIFAFQVVNKKCEPLPGVVVHIWHTNCEGQYSADKTRGTPGAGWSPAVCSGESPLGTEKYTAAQVARAYASVWHRGANATDNEGVAYFKSCFPGWYSTRTNHVHFRFALNNRDVLVTQLGFADEVCDEIHVKHPEYRGKLQDRTMLTVSGRQQDTTFSGNPKTQWIMDTARYADGTLLITKTIILNV